MNLPTRLAGGRFQPRTAATASEPLRSQLRLVTLAWVFGAMWMWTIQGAAMTQFAKHLGTPDWAFGLLAALPFIGTFAQLPAAYLSQRYGWRKGLFIWSMASARFLWVVAAAIPWVIPAEMSWLWWQAMIATLALSWALGNLGGPAWMNWMSDIIPRRVRGRYFANRNLVVRPIAVVTALVVGYLLDVTVAATQGDDHATRSLIMVVTSAIVAVAGLLGTVDILLFHYVRDPEPPRPDPQAKLLRSLAGPLRDTNFRWYLAFNFVFMCGIGFVGQYVWLYLLEVCEWSNQKANLFINVVPLLVTMATYTTWGRLCDRLGKKPVLLITGFFVTFGSVGWLWVSKESMWPGYALILLVTAVWPGMEVANFNIILGLSSSKDHGGRTGGTAHVAVNSIATAIGGTLSGALAAVVAKSLADFQYVMPSIGVVLTYHSVLFLISTVLRGAALIFAAKLHEPKAAPTSDAIRQVTTSLYGNVRQAVLLPTRVVGKVTRATYRIGRRRSWSR